MTPVDSSIVVGIVGIGIVGIVFIVGILYICAG
jgi:hypothetical protein